MNSWKFWMIARRMKALNVRKIAHFREQRATMNFKQLPLKVNFLRNSNQNVLHPLATLLKESCVLQINEAPFECVYTRLVTPSSPIYYNIFRNVLLVLFLNRISQIQTPFHLIYLRPIFIWTRSINRYWINVGYLLQDFARMLHLHSFAFG